MKTFTLLLIGAAAAALHYNAISLIFAATYIMSLIVILAFLRGAKK